MMHFENFRSVSHRMRNRTVCLTKHRKYIEYKKTVFHLQESNYVYDTDAVIPTKVFFANPKTIFRYNVPTYTIFCPHAEKFHKIIVD